MFYKEEQRKVLLLLLKRRKGQMVVKNLWQVRTRETWRGHTVWQSTR